MSYPSFNHTMFRIADPKRSIEFYEKHFGMQLLTTLEVPELGFTNYYLGFNGTKSLWQKAPWFAREGVLELCHNYDSAGFKANNGNVEPHRGFGHICFSVPKLEAYCDRLIAEGVSFQKKLADGRQKNIAFALDPDGYWIELIDNGSEQDPRFNHTMLRVKDKQAALEFYRDKLGMTVVNERDFPEAKFSLTFLAFVPEGDDTPQASREGLLELTYNYGTEKDADFKYHNGNDQPQGFGHLGFTVIDVDEAIAEYESKGITIKKRKTDGKMKFIGFILDPDGYWIEILPRAAFPETILS